MQVKTMIAALAAALTALALGALPQADAVGTGNPAITSPAPTDALYDGYTGPFVVNFDNAPIATYSYAVFSDSSVPAKLVAGPYSLNWTGSGGDEHLMVKALKADPKLRFKIFDASRQHTAQLSFSVRPGPAPRCALVVPAHVHVNAPLVKVVGRLSSTCAALHTTSADWKVTHSGQVLDYFRFTSNSTDTWAVYDSDPTGIYLIVPLSARSSGDADVPQNSPAPVVRRDARVAIGGTRSGSTLTLHSTLRRYSASANGFRPWASRTVVLAYRTCTSCPWKPLRTLTTNAHGEVSYRFTTAGARGYRATAGGTSAVWAPAAAYGRF